jgi:hypothetical protein
VKHRLLDLFCGVNLPLNNISGIIIVWLRQFVSTAVNILKRNAGLVNTVRCLVPIILHGQERNSVIVGCATNFSHFLAHQMLTGNIALRLVLRKLTQKESLTGTCIIRVLWVNTIKLDWSRILVHGETSTTTNALKQSACWGANV